MLHDEFNPIDLKAFICRYAPGMSKRWDQKESSKQNQTQAYTSYQKNILDDLHSTYSPYIGQGVLGGMSDLETNALNMLKGANVWGPLSTAGTGLLTGNLGAKSLTPEMASSAFDKTVADPALRTYRKELLPTIKEAYSGPGYWGSARPKAEQESAEDIASALGTERANWMWNTEQANRAIEEAKAGRALSALGAVPSSYLGWAGGLSDFGRQINTIMNQITDPQVLSVLQSILGTNPMGTTWGKTVNDPSEFDKAKNWSSVIGPAIAGAMTGGLGGAFGGIAGGL